MACIAAPSALSFHQPYTPLRPHAAIAMRQPALIMRADRQEQPKAQRSSLRRKLDRVVTALTVGAASLMMGLSVDIRRGTWGAGGPHNCSCRST